MSLCLVCEKPLDPLEISLGKSFHFDCNRCMTCDQGPLDESIIGIWLAGKGTREHTGCRDRRLEQEILKKEVTITQAHLDHLNSIRLLAWAAPDLDIAGNSQSTEVQFRKLKIHEMDLDTLYKFLSKYQTMAALVSIVIAQKKDAQLKKASADYREKTAYEKQVERDTKRTEETRKLQLQAERIDPKLRERRKALEGLVKTFGMTLEAAEAMIAEREKKQ